ncbi:hypothetical protein O3G_MSEX003977 [Manduca sexta]|uniref:Uncharacterized protein n=1 Tax=Manduca sexta TaxID=7130 RepID=A0A921YU53_MANSE|nr:hypothetical protein O3G_MSEX003977 [Manduca sexta]
MTSMTPEPQKQPRTFYDVHCADCDAVLGIIIKDNVLKLDPESRQQRSMDNDISFSRRLLLEGFSVLVRHPSAVATPPNKPNFAEAISKSTGTTSTSKSP